MYKANFGFEFDTQEKAKEFNDGAFVCFSGCRDKNDVPDKACKTCVLIEECIKCNNEMED